MNIEGNEKGDSLAKLAIRVCARPINKIRFSDLIPHYHKVITVVASPTGQLVKIYLS